MNSDTPGASTAQNPNPSRLNAPSKRSASARFSSGDRVRAKKRITQGSALSAAKGARSAARQRRKRSRSVRRLAGTPLTP
jgi:hypothetical protein